MKKIKAIWKKRKKLIIIGAVIIAVGLIMYFTTHKSAAPQYTTVAAVRGNLVQTVSEVGTVKAAQELALNFAAMGQLQKVNVKVGDAVKQGQVLAELDQSSLLIKDKGAQADLAVAQANLDKLLAGAASSDVAVAQAQTDQAKGSYTTSIATYGSTKATVDENISQAQKRLSDLQSSAAADITPEEQAVLTAQLNLGHITQTYQQTEDNSRDNELTAIGGALSAANTSIDYVNRIITDATYKQTLSVLDMSHLTNTQNYYTQALTLQNTATADLTAAQADSSETNINAAAAAAIDYLNQAYKTTKECFSVLANSITSSQFSATTLDALKTNVNLDLNAVSGGLTSTQTADAAYRNAILSYNNNVASAQDALKQAQVNLSSAVQKASDALASAQKSGQQQIDAAQAQMDAAREAWTVAQQQLTRIKTPARSEDIDLARAQLSQAQANVDLVAKQKTDNQIIAPIDGQITAVNYDVGEQVSAAQPAINMLTSDNFEIEVDISESDISKLQAQDKADITLDAFGTSKHFNGVVSFIDPASTVIQDVIYYKVKIQFTDAQDVLADIKAGMTANVTITTNDKSDVLIVPARAVVQKTGEGDFVRVLKGKQATEVPVTVGLSGDEGMVEVVAPGLQPGDQVITFIKTAATN